jgi:hypothetical protein
MHARDQCHFIDFSRSEQALVEHPDDWVVACCCQRGHVERMAHLSSAALNGAPPRMFPESRFIGPTPTEALI